MPKKYIMVDSSGQRHMNVYDEDMPEFMEMFPGAYILETIEEEDTITQDEAEKQLDLMNQPTDYESTLKSELAQYDNVNEKLGVMFDTAFDSAALKDKFTQSLSPEEQEHIKNREFDKLSSKTQQQLGIAGLTGGDASSLVDVGTMLMNPSAGIYNISNIKKGALAPRKISKMSKVEFFDEYDGGQGSYREDLNNYLENRDPKYLNQPVLLLPH